MTDVYTSALGMPMKELKRTYAAFVDLAAQHPLSALVSQEAVDSAVAEVRSHYVVLLTPLSCSQHTHTLRLGTLM